MLWSIQFSAQFQLFLKMNYTSGLYLGNCQTGSTQRKRQTLTSQETEKKQLVKIIHKRPQNVIYNGTVPSTGASVATKTESSFWPSSRFSICVAVDSMLGTSLGRPHKKSLLRRWAHMYRPPVALRWPFGKQNQTFETKSIQNLCFSHCHCILDIKRAVTKARYCNLQV